MKDRKQELSVMNVLFCLAVIMIHILSYPIQIYEPGSLKFTVFLLPSRMISVVVQGFIFLAGVKLFLTKKDEMPYREYLSKRAKVILVPYLICNIAYSIFYIFNYNYTITLDYFLEELFYGKLAAHFYFIPLLVQFDLLLPLWKKIVNKCPARIVIPIFLVASAYFETNMPDIVQWLTNGKVEILNDRLFTTYMSFWIIGCYVGKSYDKFCIMTAKYFKLISAAFVAAFAGYAVSSTIAYNGIAKIPALNTIHYIYTVSTIIFLFAAARKLPKNTADRIPLFRFTDNQSYDIYLWHMLVLFVADNFVRDLGLAMQSRAFVFRVIVVYTFTYLVVKLIKSIQKILSEKTSIQPQAPENSGQKFRIEYKKRTGR